MGNIPYTKADSLQASYVFEGYQLFQLKNSQVSVTDLLDLSKARLVEQVDIKNNITKIVNYTKDPNSGANVLTLEVSGKNEGIKHSFQIKTDAFATGNNQLINFKTYYFMVVAYGYNNYKQFSDADPTSQDNPYLQGRRNVVITWIHTFQLLKMVVQFYILNLEINR